MTTKGYEALVILKMAGTEQELARHAAKIEEPIRKIGGSIERSQSLGRRRLAFRIARHAEGSYHLLRFQAPADRVGELNRVFRLNDAIIRFMILSAEELPAAAATGSASSAPRASSAPITGGAGTPAHAGTR